MRIVNIITKKRNKETLTPNEIQFFVSRYVLGEITDYQASALLMAIYLNGFTTEETISFTRAMIDSGKKYSFNGNNYVDKHSTGGVGDKVSLILAPLVASCGAFVPMISGRSLGHTGGTLDKLDSIHGYKTQLSKEEFISGIEKNGYAMSGQTDDFVPADKKIYALRDATGTVESIPLITSSILCKKSAEGTKGLSIDLKCGSGAFMKTIEDAQALGESLINVGKGLGLKIKISMTRMNTPLGRMVGNYLEIEESIQEMMDDTNSDLMQITKHLGANMLCLIGITKNFNEAYKMCEKNLNNGKALEHFWNNVTLQGGNPEELKANLRKRRANFSTQILASESGFISDMNSFEVGMANIALGGGRNKKEDTIDYEAGIEFFKKTGDYIERGEKIAILWSNNKEKLEAGNKIMKSSVYRYTTQKPKLESLILKEFE